MESIRIPTPKTPTHESSRDEKLSVQLLYYDAGRSFSDLRLHFPELTTSQLDYALQSRPTEAGTLWQTYTTYSSPPKTASRIRYPEQGDTGNTMARRTRINTLGYVGFGSKQAELTT